MTDHERDTDEKPIGVKKTTTVTEEPVHGDGQDVSGLEEYLDQWSGQARRFEIQRRKKFGRGWDYVGSIQFEEFSFDAIAANWGGGEFKAQGRSRKGYIPGSTWIFTIEGEPVTPRWGESDEDDTESAAGVIGAGVGSVAELVRLIRELQNPPAAATQGNPLEMAVNIVSAIQAANQPFITALLERNAKDREEPPASELLSIFREGLKLGRESGSPGDSYTAILDRALPVIRDLASRPGAPGAPTPTANHPGGTQPAGAPAGPPLPGWVTALAPYVGEMLPLAAAGRPADLYAAVVADQATEGAVLFIMEQLSRDGFRSEFWQYFPETVPFRGWFEEFLGALGDELGELVDEAEPATVQTVIPPARPEPVEAP